MKKKEKIVSIDEIIGSTVNPEESGNYIKDVIESFTLSPDLLKKLDAEAEHRWKNGGKEIYNKYAADSAFAETDEYKNYFKKWGIPITLK
ncbi:MAG: hypothetical protein M9916_04785 [Crocinitomicaceae bacterium]|nr:hypothetical protein [Crocinitomicaceae bacterium]